MRNKVISSVKGLSRFSTGITQTGAVLMTLVKSLRSRGYKEFSLEKVPKNVLYRTAIELGPRPVNWILSSSKGRDGQAVYNLAPFSFSSFVEVYGSPKVLTTITPSPTKPSKDTLNNCSKGSEVMLLPAQQSNLRSLSMSCAGFDLHESEVKACGLKLLTLQDGSVGVSESPFMIKAVVEDVKKNHNEHLVMFNPVQVYGVPDCPIQPLGRVGGNRYYLTHAQETTPLNGYEKKDFRITEAGSKDFLLKLQSLFSPMPRLELMLNKGNVDIKGVVVNSLQNSHGHLEFLLFLDMRMAISEGDPCMLKVLCSSGQDDFYLEGNLSSGLDSFSATFTVLGFYAKQSQVTYKHIEGGMHAVLDGSQLRQDAVMHESTKAVYQTVDHGTNIVSLSRPLKPVHFQKMKELFPGIMDYLSNDEIRRLAHGDVSAPAQELSDKSPFKSEVELFAHVSDFLKSADLSDSDSEDSILRDCLTCLHTYFGSGR